MEKPKPSKEHEKLRSFAGEWESIETVAPSPMGPGGTATGRMKARVELDGFFVIGEYVQEMGGQVTMRAHCVFGFDAQKGEYTWHWFDAMGNVSIRSRGKWEGDTLTFEASHGQSTARFSYRWEGKDKKHFRLENSVDGGKTWTTFKESAYTRRA